MKGLLVIGFVALAGLVGAGRNTAPAIVEAAPLQSRATPETVISVAGSHGCATRDGALWCWGDGAAGQLGDGTTQIRHMPGRVTGLDEDVTAVATGSDLACAIFSRGTRKLDPPDTNSRQDVVERSPPSGVAEQCVHASNMRESFAPDSIRRRAISGVACRYPTWRS